MNQKLFIAALALLFVFIGLYGWLQQAPDNVPGRWYSTQQVTDGNTLFQQHCAICHGSQAEGTAEWKKTDANGNYPPPPLNGSAHAWHHSIDQLARYIRQGGTQLGGVMPGFGAQLDERQVQSLIAFFQSKWPEETYQTWHQQHMQ